MIALQILAVLSVTRISFAYENDAIIIGVAAQELTPELKKLYPARSSFIAASYVKAVESSGARVVPILTNKNESYYRHLLTSINGVVLPGGSSVNGPGNPYYDSVTNIYEIATELNDKNTVFPILGVCLGYEFLITAANAHKNILTKCEIIYENLPLVFTLPTSQTTLFSNDTDANILRILNSTAATVNNHIWCALERDFNKSSLIDHWLITSVSTGTKSGLEFIASVEHDLYPYFGVQFHPEKIAFEWDPSKHFPHSTEALIANRHFYDTFAKFAKKNNNAFKSKAEEKHRLIYNYPAMRDVTGDYEQIYLF